MKYHFRNVLGTKIMKGDGIAAEADTFEGALTDAYAMSADNDMAVYVCREGETAGLPSFTEVASVRACK